MSTRLPNHCIYEQLSEDWRNRDRMTWQIPAVLIIVGGIFVVSVFGEQFNLEEEKWIAVGLLASGLFFVWVLTVFLTRNAYFQAVGDDLMERIKNGDEEQLCKARSGARRLPKRLENYSFRSAFRDSCVKLSSLLLILLCVGIGIFFTLLLLQILEKCVWWVVGGGLFYFLTPLGIVWFSWVKSPGSEARR